MKLVSLPGTDLKVSSICLGCWQFNAGKHNGTWADQSLEESKAIVDKCFDVGINFFDTAQGYAGSEATLGECLKGRRRDAVIATKYGFRDGLNTPPYSAEQIDEAVTTALTKLQTDYIDILQIHYPSFIKDATETVEELNRQVSKGRIRYYGLSNFGPKNIKSFVEMGAKPITIQTSYNLLWRSVEQEVLPLCRENNISMMGYSPLQQGLLSGNYKSADDVPLGRKRTKLFNQKSCSAARHGQDGFEDEVFQAVKDIQAACSKAGVSSTSAAISWVRQQPGVPIVICGARTPEQMEENAKSPELSEDLIKELNSITDDLKAKIGLSLDQYVTPDRCE